MNPVAAFLLGIVVGLAFAFAWCFLRKKNALTPSTQAVKATIVPGKPTEQ